jgi:Phosphotransferase enzyme family
VDDDAVRATCELFDLGEPRSAPESVGGGLTNRLWRLTTARGVFAVKRMNRDFDRADYVAWFDRAFTLEQAAFRAGVPMPRPVPVAATGRCLGELPGGGERPTTVRVHEWVEGQKLDNGTVYPAEIAARVAVILARIHGLGMEADVQLDEALRVFGDEHWRARAEQADRAHAEWAPEFRLLLPTLGELEAYLVLAHADSTPLLLSHRDSDMKNVLRTRDDELLLVDWDQAGPVSPRHDLANHALVWAGVHPGDPDVAVARAFVDAYRRAAGTNERFQETDLAELVALRLAWFDFNVRRALGERVRDESDRQLGVNVVRRNVTQLPRFARSLDNWLAVLAD